MTKIDKKVIGYIASFSRTEVLFVGDACLVMGSEKKLQHHLLKIDSDRKANAIVKKIRFCDIIRKMSYGEKIVLDEEAYERFYPLGKQIGLPLEEASFEKKEKSDSIFFLLSSDGHITRPLS